MMFFFFAWGRQNRRLRVRVAFGHAAQRRRFPPGPFSPRTGATGPARSPGPLAGGSASARGSTRPACVRLLLRGPRVGVVGTGRGESRRPSAPAADLLPRPPGGGGPDRGRALRASGRRGRHRFRARHARLSARDRGRPRGKMSCGPRRTQRLLGVLAAHRARQREALPLVGPPGGRRRHPGPPCRGATRVVFVSSAVRRRCRQKPRSGLSPPRRPRLHQARPRPP